MIAKIQNCNPESGFVLEDAAEILLYYKYVYFNKGIPIRDFRKEYMHDIKDVMDINRAMKEKNMRENKIREALGGM